MAAELERAWGELPPGGLYPIVAPGPYAFEMGVGLTQRGLSGIAGVARRVSGAQRKRIAEDIKKNPPKP